MISQGTPCPKLLFTFLTFILLITSLLCMPKPPTSYLPYILSADTYSFPPYAIAWQILLILRYLRNFPPLRRCHISMQQLRWAHFHLLHIILFTYEHLASVSSRWIYSDVVTYPCDDWVYYLAHTYYNRKDRTLYIQSMLMVSAVGMSKPTALNSYAKRQNNQQLYCWLPDSRLWKLG